MRAPIGSMFKTASQVAIMLAISTGLASVWLALRENPLTWLATLINAGAFAVIFWHGGAYGNVGLQCLQFLMCLYGWFHWVRARTDTEDNVPVGRASGGEWLLVVVMCALIIAALAIAQGIDKPNMQALDAVSSALGSAALFLQARKRVECWPVWVVTLALMAPIFYVSGAVVMVGFTPFAIGACLLAWSSWRKAMLVPRPSLNR